MIRARTYRKRLSRTSSAPAELPEPCNPDPAEQRAPFSLTTVPLDTSTEQDNAEQVRRDKRGSACNSLCNSKGINKVDVRYNCNTCIIFELLLYFRCFVSHFNRSITNFDQMSTMEKIQTHKSSVCSYHSNVVVIGGISDKAESSKFPRPSWRHQNALRTDVTMKNALCVVQKRQSFSNLYVVTETSLYDKECCSMGREVVKNRRPQIIVIINQRVRPTCRIPHLISNSVKPYS